MIFKCAYCRDLMPFLNTPGDEINDSLICPDCAKDVKKTLDQLKKLRQNIHDLIASPN